MTIITNTPLLAPYRVKENFNGGGTGAITLLGALPAFTTFASVDASTYYTYYVAEDSSNNWEVGLASVLGTALTRLIVVYSSNSNAFVNFAVAGTVYAVAAPAQTLIDGAAINYNATDIGVPTTAWLAYGSIAFNGIGSAYASYYDFAHAAPGASTPPTYLRVSVPQTMLFGPFYDVVGSATAPGASSMTIGPNTSATGPYSFAVNAQLGATGYSYSLSPGAVGRISGSEVRGSQEANKAGSYAQSHDVVLSYVQTSSTPATGTLVQPQIPVSDTTTVQGIPIAASTTYVLSGTIIGKNATDYAVFRVYAVVDRSGAGVPTIYAPTPVTLESGSAGSSAWSAAVAVDTTNNLVLVQATSPVAHWVADLRVTEATP